MHAQASGQSPDLADLGSLPPFTFNDNGRGLLSRLGRSCSEAPRTSPRLPSASPQPLPPSTVDLEEISTPPIPGDSFQGRASAVPGWQRGWLGGPGVWARLESSPRTGSGRAPSSLRSSYCSISQGSQSWGLVSTLGEQLAAGARGLRGRAYPTARHGTPRHARAALARLP